MRPAPCVTPWRRRTGQASGVAGPYQLCRFRRPDRHVRPLRTAAEEDVALVARAARERVPAEHWSSLAGWPFERHAGVVLGTAHTGSYPVAMAAAYRRLRILTPSLGAYCSVVDEEYRPQRLTPRFPRFALAESAGQTQFVAAVVLHRGKATDRVRAGISTDGLRRQHPHIIGCRAMSSSSWSARIRPRLTRRSDFRPILPRLGSRS